MYLNINTFYKYSISLKILNLKNYCNYFFSFLIYRFKVFVIINNKHIIMLILILIYQYFNAQLYYFILFMTYCMTNIYNIKLRYFIL